MIKNVVVGVRPSPQFTDLAQLTALNPTKIILHQNNPQNHYSPPNPIGFFLFGYHDVCSNMANRQEIEYSHVLPDYNESNPHASYLKINLVSNQMLPIATLPNSPFCFFLRLVEIRSVCGNARKMRC